MDIFRFQGVLSSGIGCLEHAYYYWNYQTNVLDYVSGFLGKCGWTGKTGFKQRFVSVLLYNFSKILTLRKDRFPVFFIYFKHSNRKQCKDPKSLLSVALFTRTFKHHRVVLPLAKTIPSQKSVVADSSLFHFSQRNLKETSMRPLRTMILVWNPQMRFCDLQCTGYSGWPFRVWLRERNSNRCLDEVQTLNMS